jgi:hypothetical protein
VQGDRHPGVRSEVMTANGNGKQRNILFITTGQMRVANDVN